MEAAGCPEACPVCWGRLNTKGFPQDTVAWWGENIPRVFAGPKKTHTWVVKQAAKIPWGGRMSPGVSVPWD